MKSIIFALAMLVSTTAFASQCSELYPGNQPLVVPTATELCNSFYVSVYDTRTKRVLFVSERLRHGSPVGTVKRVDSFRGDHRVLNSPVPSMYSHSGFDKGHMAPADDASSAAEMYDTFLMTNMTPQEPTLNRRAWKLLEEKVRVMNKTAGSDVFVMTIADYTGSRKQMSGIPVPTGYWKVVFIDGARKFFYAPNVPNGQVVQRQSVNIRSLVK